VYADNQELRGRVLASLGLLVCAKLLNISVPLIMKVAVDAMTAGPAGTPYIQV
jgi:ABC transporter ATM